MTTQASEDTQGACRRQNRRPIHRILWSALLVVTPVCAQLELASNDFTAMSLDELLELEVVTVSKAAEPAARAPAAVYVLTRDEILQSGARSIPDALRLVPGVNVAAVNAREYAISIRGFNSTTSDKLEVLVDGRSVYTPLFSGVFWDVLDLPLDNLDRIEIVRGPGATLWGANAVNGVINIVTRSAFETVGTAVQAQSGTERHAATLRTGTDQLLDGRAAARVYARAVERDSSRRPDGRSASDRQTLVAAGGRFDAELAQQQTVLGTAELYAARANDTAVTGTTPVENDARGASLNLLWERHFAEDRTAEIRLAYTGYRRDYPTLYRESRDTVDLQGQYATQLGSRHQLTTGLGYRHSRDETGGPPRAIIFTPRNRSIGQPSAFVQDRIDLWQDRLTLTLGSKFEHNDFTGYEVQPGVRLGLVTPDGYLWTAASRAVRTPNRFDHDIGLYCPPPDGFTGFCGGGETLRIGNPDLESENVWTYEAGWRQTLLDWLTVDLALFYSDYDQLRSNEPAALGSRFDNRLAARSRGAEVLFVARPFDHWEWRLWYAALDIDADMGDSLDQDGAEQIEGGSPDHQALMALRWSPGVWSLGAVLRHVDGLSADDVPAYTELDMVIERPLGPGLSIALIGSNLLDSQHPEYGEADERSEVERNLMLELHWQWNPPR